MISTLDILYIILSICAITVTVMIVLVGNELFHIMRDVRSVADNVERITQLMQGIAKMVLPGAERIARDASSIEERIHSFFTRTFHNRDSSKNSKD